MVFTEYNICLARYTVTKKVAFSLIFNVDYSVEEIVCGCSDLYPFEVFKKLNFQILYLFCILNL